MNPRDEMKGLLERLAEKALDNLDGYGFHIPAGLVVRADGTDNFVIPDPEGDLTDHRKIEAAILRQLRAMAAEGSIRAAALAKVVHITVGNDGGGTTETDAVKLLLDHVDQPGYLAYLTYTLADGKATPGTILYETLPERVFGSSTAELHDSPR